MSEPGCGSDVSAMTKSKGVRDGEDYVLNGQKMWLTNGARSALVATLVKTDEGATNVYGNMTTFLVEKEPGFGSADGITYPGRSTRWATRVSTTKLIVENHRISAAQVLGGEAGLGKGFYQMMDGVEVGRVNVAARACGVALRALRLAERYWP